MSDETPFLLQSGSRRERYMSLSVPAEPHVNAAGPSTTTTTSSWSSLPRKGQLAVIVFARLAEPLSERSLSSYLFYQLRWFNPSLDASEIAKQAGYLTAVFAAAQCLTSMWWGYAADSPRLGRKRVLVIGLTGTTLSALGMGFSRSLAMAFFFRFLAGALNGNVGVLRTMISEVVVERRYVHELGRRVQPKGKTTNNIAKTPVKSISPPSHVLQRWSHHRTTSEWVSRRPCSFVAQPVWTGWLTLRRH